MKKSYSFLGIDEGKQALFRGDTQDNELHWWTDLSDYPLARDMQRLDRDLALIGYDRGYFVCEIKTGKIVKQCDRWTKVTSAVRLPGGQTLVTGLNLEGTSGVGVVILDSEDRVEKVLHRPGDYVRLMRPGASKTYYFCVNDHILQTDQELSPIRKLASEGFLHAWKPMLLPTGEILVSAGYGAFLARFSSGGEELQTFGGKDRVPASVEPFFYGGFDVSADGSLLVANWQGHGPDNGSKGRQLLRFSAEGTYLESWSWEKVSSFQGILLVDGY